MATRHFTLTVGTAGSTLYTLVGDTTAKRLGSCRQLTIQPHSENLGVIKIGGSNSADSFDTNNYGIELPTPVTSIPCAPYPFESPQGFISLADIKVLAANATDKIHVMLVLP